MERNHLCNFERGRPRGIFMNLYEMDEWFRRCCLKKKFTDDGQ